MLVVPHARMGRTVGQRLIRPIRGSRNRLFFLVAHAARISASLVRDKNGKSRRDRRQSSARNTGEDFHREKHRPNSDNHVVMGRMQKKRHVFLQTNRKDGRCARLDRPKWHSPHENGGIQLRWKPPFRLF